MFKNYGDYNFFEYGVLVDDEHGDNDFNIIYCRRYDDDENLYQFSECNVDITDSWIDKKAVMDYIGMNDADFDAVLYAIGCIEYYGVENFGGLSYYYDNMHMTKEDICEILKNREIASDHLNIEW